MSDLHPNPQAAAGFLASLPGDTIHITAIKAEGGKIIGRSFPKTDMATVIAALAGANEKGNGIYFNINNLSRPLNTAHPKAGETEVNTVYAFHVDADVDKSIAEPAAFAKAKADLLAGIRALPQPPTIVIDSGNGFGLFWMLKEGIAVTAANRQALKAVNIALRDQVRALPGGSADACENLDRVMRVPHLINWPNAVKVKRGRVPVLSNLVDDDRGLGVFHQMEDFAAVVTANAAEPPDNTDYEKALEKIEIPDTVDLALQLDGPPKMVKKRGKEIEEKPERSDLHRWIVDGSDNEKFGDGTRSDFVYAVTCALWEARFTEGEIVWVLTNPDFKVSEHILDQTQRSAEAQALKTIRDARRRGDARTPKEDFGDEPEENLDWDAIRATGKKYLRPQVLLVDGELPRITARIQALLNGAARNPLTRNSDLIFQRGGELAHLNRNKIEKPRKPRAGATVAVDAAYHVENELLIKPATLGWLLNRAMRQIDFFRPGAKGEGWTKTDLSYNYVSQLRDIGESNWTYPTLRATVEAPTLRPDGSILSKPGYDPRSGLFLDTAGIDFPPIPEKPTATQVKAALEILKEPLRDFQFKDGDGHKGLSLAVQLSAMLTATVRRSLPTAPAYGFGANAVAAGKTQMAQMNAIIGTGRRTGERPFTPDADEQRKTLSAAFAAGDAVLLFDNVDVDITGGPLCTAISGQVIKTRRLGGNSADDQIEAPTCALVQFTGNKLTASGDMTDRLLICELFIEKRFDAGRFKYMPLNSYLLEHRPALIAAALTVMRGYFAAGCPEVKSRKSRYPEWQQFCSDPLVWLGLSDPVLAFDRAVKGDPQREMFADLLRSWLKVKVGKPSDWRTTKEVLGIEGTHEAIAAARAVTVERLTVRNATEYLEKKVDETVEGWRLEKAGGTMKHATTWRLVEVQ